MKMTAIDFYDVAFGYSKRMEALFDINLTIEEGEFVVLFGPNGSGKTTLFKLIAKLLKPCGGKIELFKRNTTQIPTGEMPGLVSYMPQVIESVKDMPLSVRDIIDFGYYARNGWFNRDREGKRACTESYAEKLGIIDLLEKPVGELSGGESKRMHLARVLSQGAGIMLLDEPTAHLDITSKKDFYSELARIYDELKITVLLIVHSVEDIPNFSRRMIYLKDGRIIEDGSKEKVIKFIV